MKCMKCGQEITKEDEAKGNFRHYMMNDYYHILCPGTYHKCHYCGKDITDGSKVKTPLGYRHQSCTGVQ